MNHIVAASDWSYRGGHTLNLQVYFTTEKEARVDDPDKSAEQGEILMSDPQLVIEADGDKGKKSVMELVIIKKAQP